MKLIIFLSFALLSFQSFASGLNYYMVVPFSNSGASGAPEAPWESPVGEGALHTNGVTVTCLGMTDLEEFYLAETNKTYRVVYSEADAKTYASLACTSNITDMKWFFVMSTFNEDISSWDTSNVTDMGEMFSQNYDFNQDISNWNTSKVTNMRYMFYVTDFFNQDISSWDTSSVTDMEGMLSSTLAFNQDISSWNTSSVTNMSGMFASAQAFNQNISSWDTSNVTDMSSMFSGSPNFNQDLSVWCVSNLPVKPSNFDVNAIAWTDEAKKPVWGTCPAP